MRKLNDIAEPFRQETDNYVVSMRARNANIAKNLDNVAAIMTVVQQHDEQRKFLARFADGTYTLEPLSWANHVA